MSLPWYSFTKAIVRQIPSTLAGAALRREEPSSPIDLARARTQHDRYVKVLRELVETVVVLPPDDAYPDCVFVEDPAVVCDRRAVVCNLGHASRRGEAAPIRDALRRLGVSCFDMSSDATMDGGDVLFTGREFFVGLSERTNQKGVDFLAATFSDYPTHTVSVKDSLHLKSLLSMAGPSVIVVADTPAGKNLWQQIVQSAAHQYECIWVPDEKAANCLYINGTLVHRAEFPNSVKIFESLSCRRIEMSATELSKADGCLTCCSLLIT